MSIRRWTPEQRARQAEVMRRAKPWLKTKGPSTPEGKAKAVRNAYKGNPRANAVAALKLQRLMASDAAIFAEIERANLPSPRAL